MSDIISLENVNECSGTLFKHFKW